MRTDNVFELQSRLAVRHEIDRVRLPVPGVALTRRKERLFPELVQAGTGLSALADKIGLRYRQAVERDGVEQHTGEGLLSAGFPVAPGFAEGPDAGAGGVEG
ncbi:hypothetical protein [Streptomyces cinereoruber]|uniref:hypothetical protein n=1 Tax=Streptomyces cinereoruber TaxID=67260 RepID=UPI003666D3CC